LHASRAGYSVGTGPREREIFVRPSRVTFVVGVFIFAISVTPTPVAGLRQPNASRSVMGTWGSNANGQLGDGTKAQRTVPVKVRGLGRVIAIAAGGEHSVAVQPDGTVWAWGGNAFGELGNGSTKDSKVPVQVTGCGRMARRYC
jgi:hypothetical protein